MLGTSVVLPSAGLAGSNVCGHQLRAVGLPQLMARRPVGIRSRGFSVRAAQQQQDNVPSPGTKVAAPDNKDEEPLRVFDNTPAGQFARPESERRPELGNTDFQSVMKFDGPAPETINGRLAMVGMVWAAVAERASGLSVAQQTLDSSGFIFFLAIVPLFIWASFVPIFGWNESPDSRSFGPFNAKAERWNGRTAMIGFVALLLTENFILHGPLLGLLPF